MKRVDNAINYFNNGYNCAQAVLASFGAEFDMNKELAFKVAAAFGGGIARCGRTCGAVTGALMVIGLKYGMTKIGDNESKNKTYSIANEFINEFEGNHSSIICKDLIGFDMSDKKEREQAFNREVFNRICPKLVKNAVEILEKILI
ncbi:MAG: C_GCAxxG_C_C family protein [Candidatus Lokiarchaeota archaeon]|nr:C_GCAxxG_C_C family protein [Candidatus Lokiarchaeota archaeon]